MKRQRYPEITKENLKNCRRTNSMEGPARFWPDDDRIVSHDASGLDLHYHCVRDVIIHSTLSG